MPRPVGRFSAINRSSLMPDKSQAVTIRFQLSKSDVYWAYVRNILRGPWLAALFLVMGLPCALIALMDTARPDEPLFCAGVALTLCGVFNLLGTPYIRATSTLMSPTFQGPLAYTFSGAGVSTKGRHASSHSDWVLIRRVSESSRFVILWTFQSRFHLIPKGQASPADLASLKSILRACVKGKVQLKP